MASNRATEINLVKTLLGAGMLALPFAFKCQGFLIATFSIFFGQFASLMGALMLAFSSTFVPEGSASFFKVAKITYPSLAIWFDVAIALKCFGVCVSYLVIIGNLMPSITDYFNWETSSLFWLIIAMFIVTPISLQKKLESLKTASLIALSSVVYLLVLATVHFVKRDTVSGEVRFLSPLNFSAFVSSVPIFVFAFTMSQNMFSAINEINDKSMKNVFGVCLRSTSLAAVIYLAVGGIGYLSFGDLVGDNLVSMYEQSLSSTVGRLAIVILVMFSYPLMCHPARTSTVNVIEALRTNENTPLLGGNTNLHAVVTSVILVLSFVLAISLNSLEMILSFVGATGATAVSFIFPGLFAYSLAFRDGPLELSLKQRQTIKWGGLALAVYGSVVAVLAVGVNIVRLVKGN